MFNLNTLKLAIVVPAVTLLAACATTAPSEEPVLVKSDYICADNSTVSAVYSPETDTMSMTATIPKLDWIHQPLMLTAATSGSGMRFINEDSDKVSYDWHSNGGEAILTTGWSTGESYKLMCTLSN